jgi:hypothetical protein
VRHDCHLIRSFIFLATKAGKIHGFRCQFVVRSSTLLQYCPFRFMSHCHAVPFVSLNLEFDIVVDSLSPLAGARLSPAHTPASLCTRTCILSSAKPGCPPSLLHCMKHKRKSHRKSASRRTPRLPFLKTSRLSASARYFFFLPVVFFSHWIFRGSPPHAFFLCFHLIGALMCLRLFPRAFTAAQYLSCISCCLDDLIDRLFMSTLLSIARKRLIFSRVM